MNDTNFVPISQGISPEINSFELVVYDEESEQFKKVSKLFFEDNVLKIFIKGSEK